MMSDLRATPVRKQTPTNTHVSPILKSCTHVFVRHDVVRKSLQKPYDGPYRVQKCAEKHYTIDINGRNEVISIDRLKPAFHDVPSTEQAAPPLPQSQQQSEPPSSTPIRVTRYGHRAHWPKRLASTFIYQLGRVL